MKNLQRLAFDFEELRGKFVFQETEPTGDTEAEKAKARTEKETKTRLETLRITLAPGEMLKKQLEETNKAFEKHKEQFDKLYGHKEKGKKVKGFYEVLQKHIDGGFVEGGIIGFIKGGIEVFRKDTKLIRKMGKIDVSEEQLGEIFTKAKEQNEQMTATFENAAKDHDFIQSEKLFWKDWWFMVLWNSAAAVFGLPIDAPLGHFKIPIQKDLRIVPGTDVFFEVTGSGESEESKKIREQIKEKQKTLEAETDIAKKETIQEEIKVLESQLEDGRYSTRTKAMIIEFRKFDKTMSNVMISSALKGLDPTSGEGISGLDANGNEKAYENMKEIEKILYAKESELRNNFNASLENLGLEIDERGQFAVRKGKAAKIDAFSMWETLPMLGADKKGPRKKSLDAFRSAKKILLKEAPELPEEPAKDASDEERGTTEKEILETNREIAQLNLERSKALRRMAEALAEELMEDCGLYYNKSLESQMGQLNRLNPKRALDAKTQWAATRELFRIATIYNEFVTSQINRNRFHEVACSWEDEKIDVFQNSVGGLLDQFEGIDEFLILFKDFLPEKDADPAVHKIVRAIRNYYTERTNLRESETPGVSESTTALNVLVAKPEFKKWMVGVSKALQENLGEIAKLKEGESLGIEYDMPELYPEATVKTHRRVMLTYGMVRSLIKLFDVWKEPIFEEVPIDPNSKGAVDDFGNPLPSDATIGVQQTGTKTKIGITKASKAAALESLGEASKASAAGTVVTNVIPDKKQERKKKKEKPISDKKQKKIAKGWK